ncbi:MAG: hypothetical protein HYV07_32010 [Deltaproteobacteria bacterium]|nr:hypothetical protein [Deltaproteobacteria bacterium]
MNGPVTASLEREVASEVRKHGAVVWLDKEATYTSFVARAEGDESSAAEAPQ